jgi:hypothetical protein
LLVQISAAGDRLFLSGLFRTQLLFTTNFTHFRNLETSNNLQSHWIGRLVDRSPSQLLEERSEASLGSGARILRGSKRAPITGTFVSTLQALQTQTHTACSAALAKAVAKSLQNGETSIGMQVPGSADQEDHASERGGGQSVCCDTRCNL